MSKVVDHETLNSGLDLNMPSYNETREKYVMLKVRPIYLNIICLGK